MIIKLLLTWLYLILIDEDIILYNVNESLTIQNLAKKPKHYKGGMDC
jgi:hypothetical protein